MCAAQSMYTQPVEASADASSIVTSIIVSVPELRPAVALGLHHAVETGLQDVCDVLVGQSAHLLSEWNPLAEASPERTSTLHRLCPAPEYVGLGRECVDGTGVHGIPPW